MSLSTQFYTMLSMIAMGSFFGASLDTYQRFLNRKNRKKLIVFVNDILFWIIHGLIAFYILFLVNYGELRFYLLLALLCGFSAYQALLKKFYLKVLELVIHLTKETIRFLYKLFITLIYTPIKWLVLFIIGALLFLGKVLLSLVKFMVKVLLWVLKVVLYPIKLIGKGLLQLVPKQVKQAFQKLFNVLEGYFIIIKNVMTKGIHFIKKIFRI
ncbi:spore cortex biosynthesis protein YabQ [Bacillus sp. FJAT-49732]|uniref:Spore cortex biosynthesis protein YabQ n=1 Tax=Lederbergia citrisecunda TaxID=2833583 RepID=A0A942TNH1_9BACI|nr:spore cortex biosynthesis protein YabQ [Lederbergia citrisecunda]MBS4201495.1 spore cortex biosynthesis protein YabQ [Lederbergia citrisecunda]